VKKLNKKLGSATAVGGIAVVVVVVGLLAWKSNKNFDDAIVSSTQQLLLNTAKAEAESIEAVVSEIQANLDFVAGDPRIQGAAVNNKSYEDVISTEGYSILEAAHKHLAGKVHGLYRLDAKGIIQSRIPWDATKLGGDYSSKPGVKTVIETHKPCVSELFLSNSGKRCFSVCYPIFKAEQFVGVIRAAVHLSTIREMAKQIKVGEKGYVQIIDDDGWLLAHPMDEHVGKDIIATRKEAFPDCDWFELEEIVKDMKSGETGVGIYHSVWWHDEEPDIVKKLTAFAPIRFGKDLWSLGAVMGYDEIAASVKAHTRNIAAVSLLLVLVFVAGGVWLHNVQKDKIRLTAKAQSADELLKLNNQLEEEIVAHKQAEERLVEAKQHAEAGNIAKSQFLANMSHEIRTPMNAIMGFTDLLADEDLAEEQHGWVNTIRGSGRHLLQVIDDILDYSKIEAGKLEVEIMDCSLAKVFNVVESMMHAIALEKGVEFKIQEAKDVPAYIQSDADRLKQCLINLVNNAIKFTEEGHVHVNVVLEHRNDQPFVRFDVEDTGIGIPPDKQAMIFESFTQADGDTSRKYGGTGLGLAITKKLAEIMGGELALHSEEGKGSIFSLIVPAGLNVAEQPTLNVHNLGDSRSDDDGAKPDQEKSSGRVLVAEDVATNQMLAKLLLEKMGLEVIVVGDGKEAVQMARAEEFDLILMDMQMPYMNGYEATRILREDGLSTPIIALTAHAMDGDEEKCLDAGCDDYLSKPLGRGELSEILQKYLSSEDHNLVEQTDSAKSEADDMSQLCSDESLMPTEQNKTFRNALHTSHNRMNCWEFEKCGRGPGGSRVAELGTCSAATETACDGINGGKNAGRYCWRVAGTLCGGKPQGTFAEKLLNCIECDFYKQIQEQLSSALVS